MNIRYLPLPADARLPGMRTIPVATVVLLAALSGVSAAQQSTPGAFVDVSATPKIALVGQPVTIAGSTGYHEKKKVATVLVRHESGAPTATLTATVTPKGDFTVTFADTKKPGKYSVTVTAPDGTGKGQTQFRVDSPATLLDDVEHVSTELDTRTNKLLAYVKSAIASLPPSAERDEALKKEQDIENKRKMVTLPPVKILGDLRKLNEITLPDQQVYGTLRDWVSKGEEAIETIDKSPISEKPAPICETIHTALEGAKLGAYAFTITGSLFETLGNMAVDKLMPAGVQSMAGRGAGTLAVTSVLKIDFELAKHEGNVYAALAAITMDLTEFLIDHVFERYCSEYKGPVNAKMTMVWKEGVQPWMKYGVVLEGELRLRYPKEAPTGKPVYMTGEFEGNATHFTFWEDVTVVSPLPKSLLVLQRLWLQPPTSVNSPEKLEAMGQVARALTPAYFDIPVIAEMTGENIKLQFKPARVDFSDVVKNRLLFVVHNGLYPDFRLFTFPIQKAHWILSKGLEDPAILTIVPEGSGHAIRVKKQNHKDSPDKSVNVDWTITITAAGSAEHEKKD
jgi:hypothetical protein